MKVSAKVRIEIRRGVPWWSSDQNSSSRNLSLLHHLHNNRRRLSRLLLSNESLRCRSWLESVGVDAQAADVGMRRDEVHSAELLALGHGLDGLGHIR